MNTQPPLPLSWFQRPALEVAPDLMGRTLCRRLPDGRVLKKRITEVEAYIGPEDLACHAHRRKTCQPLRTTACGWKPEAPTHSNLSSVLRASGSVMRKRG